MTLLLLAHDSLREDPDIDAPPPLDVGAADVDMFRHAAEGTLGTLPLDELRDLCVIHQLGVSDADTKDELAMRVSKYVQTSGGKVGITPVVVG